MKQSTAGTSFDWIEHYPLAVDVCDREGTIIAMNRLAAENFKSWGGAALLGKSVFDCHPPAANAMIRSMLNEQCANTYYTEKQGKRNLVHQCPWYDTSGAFAGLVETIIPLPREIPVFQRG